MAFSREDRISEAVNKSLMVWSKHGRFTGVYFHVANETQPPKMNSWQAKNFWDKRNRIGIKKGAPDWVISWQGGYGFIELKTPQEYMVSPKTGKTIQDPKRPQGKPSDEQLALQAACDDMGINYAFCESVDEVEATLVAWGGLV